MSKGFIGELFPGAGLSFKTHCRAQQHLVPVSFSGAPVARDIVIFYKNNININNNAKSSIEDGHEETLMAINTEGRGGGITSMDCLRP